MIILNLQGGLIVTLTIVAVLLLFPAKKRSLIKLCGGLMRLLPL